MSTKRRKGRVNRQWLLSKLKKFLRSRWFFRLVIEIGWSIIDKITR